jgi:hypothetical protein
LETLIFLINEGIKAGFRSENKAEDLALQIIAIIEGAVMLTKVSGKLDYMQSLMKTVENLINFIIYTNMSHRILLCEVAP